MILKRMRDIDRIPRWIEAEERKLRRERNEDFVALRQSHHEEIDKKRYSLYKTFAFQID